MRLAVLSNKGQYNALAEKYQDISSMKILCDNPTLYNFLNGKKINFEKLDDELIRDKWQSINVWACEKALLWEGLVQDKRLFSGIEFNKAIYVYFMYYLILVLKNYCFADFIHRTYKPERIVFFDDAYSPLFPQVNGNYFLNLFLESIAKKEKIEDVPLHSYENSSLKSRVSLKEGIRSFAESLYGSLPRHRRKKEVFIACGALNHLAPVITMLKKRNREILMYDFDFNLSQFKFCRREKIPYLTQECFIACGEKAKTIYSDYESDFKRLMDSLAGKSWFTFEGMDISKIICDSVLACSREYLETISDAHAAYSKILELYDVKGVILDEDIAPKRAFMAAFFKSKGIRNFCISHAYFALKFSLRESERIFDLSTTFVHSGYEKLFYESWGWKKENINVAGIPRYDRLTQLRSRVSQRRDETKKGSSKIMNILFCSSSILYYTPNTISFAGHGMYEYGSYGRRYLDDAIKAIDAYPMRLIIKPHYKWEEPVYSDLVRRYNREKRIILKPASSDLFGLMAASDLVVFCNWSTGIMESIILGVPSVVVDYSGLDDSFPFAKQGLCMVVRSFEELKNYIKNVYSSFNDTKGHTDGTFVCGDKTFYSGINDGNNTLRVVDYILGHT